MLVADGGAGAAPVDLVEIAINIEAIEDLADFLSEQLSQNITPVTADVIREHRRGDALLGPDRSLVYLSVKSQYDAATTTDVATMRSYVDATLTMAVAMRALAGVYRDADGVANATLDEVIGAFDDSWTKLQDLDKRKAQRVQAIHGVPAPPAGETPQDGGGFTVA